uniref:Lipocalin 26 n=1 Tax=Rhipicephalus microplus TaxID=6941 RepID=A0A034WXN5_RHIMP
MLQVTSIIIACVCTFWVTPGDVFGDLQTRSENNGLDFFKVIQIHPNGVAILDTDEDGDLECLKAVRTKFEEGQAADYVWILKGLHGRPKRNITVHFKKADQPDRAIVAIDDDEDWKQESRLIYADYKNCAVVEIPYNDNTQCMLWTSEEAKDNVPSQCTEEFRKNCDKEVVAYDKATCNQV